VNHEGQVDSSTADAAEGQCVHPLMATQANEDGTPKVDKNGTESVALSDTSVNTRTGQVAGTSNDSLVSKAEALTLSDCASSELSYPLPPSAMTSLAVAPYAGFLRSILTDPSSSHIDCLLCDSRERDTTWRAPIGLNTVEMTIVLPAASMVSQIVLQVGGDGYRFYDVPVVHISTSMDITCESTSSHGFYHIRPPPAHSASDGRHHPSTSSAGPDSHSDPLKAGDDLDDEFIARPYSNVICTLPAPTLALIVNVQLTLPKLRQELLGLRGHMLRVREEEDESEGWISISPPKGGRRTSLNSAPRPASIFPDQPPDDDELEPSMEVDSSSGNGQQVGGEKEESISLADDSAVVVPAAQEASSPVEECQLEEVRAEVACRSTSTPPRQLHLSGLRVLGETVSSEESIASGSPGGNDKAVNDDRAAYTRALDDPHYGQAVPTQRTRIVPLWEEVRAGGRMLFLALPMSTRWISGFRIAAPPSICSIHEDPHPLILRVGVHTESRKVEGETAMDELWGPVKPVGEYSIPIAKEGTLLHFDFTNAVQGNMFVFELTGRLPTTRPTGDFSDSDSILSSLHGRIRVFQNNVVMK